MPAGEFQIGSNDVFCTTKKHLGGIMWFLGSAACCDRN